MKNSLAVNNPTLAAEWHPILNQNLTPEQITCGSGIKVYWMCSKNSSHVWQTSPNKRKQRGCPFCSGRYVTPETSLTTKRPDLASEWHPTLNGNLTPDKVTAKSNKTFWWQCPKSSLHIYQMTADARTKCNCPFCSGKKVCVDNCLNAKRPDISAEWHPTLNEPVSPNDITCGTKRKFWWKCSQNHEWKASPNNRTKFNSWCPFCAGKKACTENCLALHFPDVASEWYQELNANITPHDVTSKSDKKVYFRCPKNHVYQARIADRTYKNSGCPICSISHGEKLIKNILINLNLEFQQQVKFENCKHKTFLPFDFKIITEKEFFLIEFNGEQHYQQVSFFHKGNRTLQLQQKRDAIKIQFCKDNNIPLLVIHHSEKDQAKEKIMAFLNL